MKFFSLLFAAVLGTLLEMNVEQDPCADCTELRAIRYQECAMKFGDPCKKDDEGKRADVPCCLARQKHNRCVECSARDCDHDTCEVNAKYYNFHKQEEKDEDFDSREMKKRGWGTNNTA